jgi:glycosyltransferase involved in cell wall biosynthesis
MRELKDDRPIRVLLTTPLMSRPGGVAQFLRVLRPHWQNHVQYFTIGSPSDGERVGRAAWRVLRDSWRFAHTLRRGGYDVVHLNPSIGPKALLRDAILLLIAKAFRKAVVVFAHGWDDACGRALATHLSKLFRLVYGRADAFVVLGHEFKQRLQLLGYDRTVFVQWAPIDDELLADCQRGRVPRDAGGSSLKFQILFLARVEKEKGIYEALETYRLLKQKYPSVSLIVAGDGSQLSSTVRHVSSQTLADVLFTGHVEGPAKYEVFRTADAYLFPSYSEGLPISVLEAMAYGLPIVTCAVGGLRDFFEDGVMGFSTESRNPEILASLLSRLICDPGLCSSISSFNRNYARDHFRGPQIAARLEGVYRFLLGSTN